MVESRKWKRILYFLSTYDFLASTLSAALPQRAGRRSNPCLLVFSQALNRLSYQPRSMIARPRSTKKAQCHLRDTGLLCSRRPKADVTCAGETRRIHLANHYPPDSRGSSIEPLDNVWYSVRKVAGVGGTRVAQQTISRHHSVEWARNTLFRSVRIRTSAVKTS